MNDWKKALTDTLGIFPQYTYKQNVSIRGGFYKGHTGQVLESYGDNYYRVQITNTFEFARIHASTMEPQG